MYYALNEKISLRGWQRTTNVLVNTKGKIITPLNNDDFSLLLMCDGETDIDNVLSNDSDLKKRLEILANAKIITVSETPRPIQNEQKYRYYDNRYFERIHWSITGKCNFRCKHCYMDAPDALLGELDFDEIKSIIDQLAECGVRKVSLTGGEPLIRSDFWDIVDYLTSRGILVDKIYSNGWLINDYFIDKVKERGIQPDISISFDGLGWHDWMRGIPGAEDHAIQALKLCVANKLNTDVEFCLHNGNKHVLRDTINYLAQIGVLAMKVGTVANTPLWKCNACGNEMTTQDYYDALLAYIPHFFEDKMPMNVILGGGLHLFRNSKKYIVVVEKSKGEDDSCLNNYMCGAARFSAYITADGRFLPCMTFTSVEVQKEFPLISELGVRQCMSDSYYINFVSKRVKDLYDRNVKCNNCEYRLKCCGGCRALAMLANDGDLYASDPEACFLFENGYPDKFRKAADEAIAKYCQEDTKENK